MGRNKTQTTNPYAFYKRISPYNKEQPTMKKNILLFATFIMFQNDYTTYAAIETVGDYTYTYEVWGAVAVLTTGKYPDRAVSHSTTGLAPIGALEIPIMLGGFPVIYIGDWAFHGCMDLTDVIMPESVMFIERSAFNGCSGMTNLLISPNIRTIGDSAFMGCSGLSSIKIPDNVISIAWGAFQSCNNLTNITIPASVTLIGNDVFSFCTNLREVRFEGDAPNVGRTDAPNIGYPLYLYSGTSTDLTTYVYPDSKRWNGDPNSILLPELWCGRIIKHMDCFTDTEVPVPHEWLKKTFPNDSRSYNYLASMMGKNGLPVWQSWVALLNPNNKDSHFTVMIDINEKGEPVISCDPCDTNLRNYICLGKASLSDSGPWEEADGNSRFFKVKVEVLPLAK